MTEPRWAESCAPLVERLRDRILAEGPITFAAFMAAALYDPDDGYYVARTDRAAREGDFLSAPEQDPLFGGLLARQVAECWERLGRPPRLVVREDGAGSGALAEALLASLRKEAPAAFAAARYQPVEVDPGRAAAIRARLTAAGLGPAVEADDAEAADETTEADDRRTARQQTPPPDPPRLDPGLVIANELLDALPVHRLVGLDGDLRELYVDWVGGWFAERPGALSDPRLAAQLQAEGVVLAEGQRTEVSLAGLDWLADLGRDLGRGYAFLVDYGAPAPERHAASRPEGLLRTYRAHHAGDDPFRAVGRQDLTAHVDWTAVEGAARAAGLTVLGRAPLAAFALAHDAGTLLTALGHRAETTMDGYRSARAALRDLLDPRRLGAFEVLVLGRGVPLEPPLRGLAVALPPGYGRPAAPHPAG